ncbi:DUF305 domain-containing protein [Pseudonocardia sp. KRD291]|uniref:DUF305 domain-containing protein n=1 Tax=Pseudonocardia sp. KRD291 TaxID=2792007 RepID=UPI0027E2397A|nr:DUF305 domain-containing protein [Pseudonocardia sp. KRD291]
MSETETREPAGVTEPGPRTPRPSAAPWWSVVVLLAVIALLGGLLIGATGPGAGSPDADSVDVGFAQDMSVHHRQAVEMASWERDRTADPALRQLAFDIETTQNQQVGRMQGWLGLWDQPALPSGGHMGWMAGDHGGGAMAGMASVAAMPGMATSADLRRMRQTPEPALDTVFLQLMLRHHEGGASMLEYGRDHAETVEVRNLASQMLSAQTSESELMKQLLARRGAQPLPL